MFQFHFNLVSVQSHLDDSCVGPVFPVIILYIIAGACAGECFAGFQKMQGKPHWTVPNIIPSIQCFKISPTHCFN